MSARRKRKQKQDATREGLANERLARQYARADGWRNAFTGSGYDGYDKSRAHTPFLDLKLNEWELASMWRQDDLARKIVEDVVEDALRKGFSFLDTSDAAKPKDAQEVGTAAKKWCVAKKLAEGLTWGRLYGGAAIWLGVINQGEQREPLDDEKIGADDLQFLHVVDRRSLVPFAWYTDALNPKFGEPSHYRIQAVGGGGALTVGSIHESRLVLFGGALTSRTDKLENAGWDDSVLQPVFDVLRQADVNWKSVGALMADMAQAVYKIKNFISMLAQKELGAIEERMRLMDQQRSSGRGIALDADKEDFERKATPIAGVEGLLLLTFQRVAGAAKEPMTKLFGMSPAGLNATGESDAVNWEARVEEYQTKEVTPPLERLARACARSEGAQNVDAVSVSFPSLRTMTPKENAEIQKLDAERDQIHIANGMALPEEKALSRWGKGKYSSEDSIDIASREKSLKAELALINGKTEPASDKPTPLTPSTMELILTMNEARGREGLPPLPVDGDLTIAEYKAKHAAVIAAGAAAEAGKDKPTDPDAKPPTLPGMPPPEPPAPDDDETEPDEENKP